MSKFNFRGISAKKNLRGNKCNKTFGLPQKIFSGTILLGPTEGQGIKVES